MQVIAAHTYTPPLHLIDVRAPIEFAQGSIPHATNLPILNDTERSIVGTCYKEQGPQAAIALGHELVHGSIKEARINAWAEFVRSQDSCAVMCARGGLRSQTARGWLLERGIQAPCIIGGYKALRAHLTSHFETLCAATTCWVITGKTGSGKTQLIERFGSCNLEALAAHRGSAFGGVLGAQPAQSTFENQLSVTLWSHAINKPLIVEDESLMIGKIRVPQILIKKIQSSAIIIVDEPQDKGAARILHDYVESQIQSNLFETFKESLSRIRKKLGDERYRELLADITEAERIWVDANTLEPNLVWITKLLQWYYDPLYDRIAETRPQLFKGDYEACKSWLMQNAAQA